MSNLTILYLQILAIHFIADFVLQSNWMAQNKSKSNRPLLCHVFVYFVTFLILLTLCVPSSRYSDLYFFVYINAAIHFFVDWATSRINAYLWAKGDVHNFFVGVGFDQLIHATTLISTAYWIFA